MSTFNDYLKPMFEDSLESLDKITTINCSDKDLENICIDAYDVGSYSVSNNVIGSCSGTAAAITRGCLLCGDSTQSQFNMICPRCQKIWNILIDTFQGDV